MKPVVGLSCSFEENRYFLKHQYADAVFAAGAIPVILPYVPEEEIAPTLDRLDGLLLTGRGRCFSRLLWRGASSQD